MANQYKEQYVEKYSVSQKNPPPRGDLTFHFFTNG